MTNKTYEFKLLPTKEQHLYLENILGEQMWLYNSFLEERKDYYIRHVQYKVDENGEKIPGRSKYDQYSALTEIRDFDPSYAEIPCCIQRHTINKLDEAYNGFFRRVKSGKGKAGFPRMKTVNSFKSFGFSNFNGITLRIKRQTNKHHKVSLTRKLYWNGLPGGLKINWHRDFPFEGMSEIKKVVFKRKRKGWYVYFSVHIPDITTVINAKNAVGIDMGIENLMTFSDGTPPVPYRDFFKENEVELKEAKRAFSKTTEGTKAYRLALYKLQAIEEHVANSRKTYLHQESKKLVDSLHAMYAVEDLQVLSMLKNKKDKKGNPVYDKYKHLHKPIQNASWRMLRDFITYKAANAGKLCKAVDPRYTTQDCHVCKYREKRELTERTFKCKKCGTVHIRDVNSAINILDRA